MIKKVFAIIASVGLTMFFACNQFSPKVSWKELSLKKDEKIGKWGYVDNKGKAIIPFTYDNAYPFLPYGLAKVELNEKFCLIDEENKKITPFYDEILDFLEDLAKVRLNEKWGYIDTTGQEVISPKYDFVSNFDENLAKVIVDGKYGFIDKTGKDVAPQIYSDVGNFTEDLAWVKINDKYGFIDKAGNEIIPPEYDHVENFSNGLARVELSNEYGYIDKEGKEIIPVNHDYVGHFKNGLVPVKSNGKYGYKNEKGEIVIALKYDEAEDFVNGHANVRLAESAGIIDTAGIFTVQSIKIPLLEAVKKKYIRFSGNGNSIQSSFIQIENLTDLELDLTIPPGTFLISKSGSCQNMVLTNPQDIVLRANDTYSGNVNTACMNIHRNIPDGDNIFGIAQRPSNHLLSKVITLLNEKNCRYNVIQAAIWIITDNADYYDMGILQNQSYERVIDVEDYREAVSIVNEAKNEKNK